MTELSSPTLTEMFGYKISCANMVRGWARRSASAPCRWPWFRRRPQVRWVDAGAARVHRPRGAAAAAAALASRAPAGSEPGTSGRCIRQVQIAEGDGTRERLGQEQIGPELADIVSRLRRAMRRAARAADPGLGLSVAQLELLSCMAEHPGIRPSQLARMLRLAPRSVATLLGGLQSAGYVTRTPGADVAGDRRTVSLDLSGPGAAAVVRWHRVNEEIILAALPEHDQAALRDAAPALRDLTSSIDAQAD